MATRTKEHTVRMVKTSMDLSKDTRQEMVQMLNQNMADLFDLFSQTKQAHWNVKGPQFFQLHKLYDELADMILPHVDTVAERITALGGAATGTVRMAARSTRLSEFAEGPIGSMESVRMLVDCYAALAKNTREAIDIAEEAKDMVTSDLMIEVTNDLDKALYFLESHLQGE